MSYSPLTRHLRRLAVEAQLGERTSLAVDQPMSRRAFLRGAATLAAGVAAGPLVGPMVARAARAHDVRVVVIGAGAAGMRCAHRLRDVGISAQVFEAADRIGGRTYSIRGFFANGQVGEHGGEFISSEHRATRDLARRLALELEGVNGGGLPEGEEIYRIDGGFYTYAEASEDWRVAWPAFRDEERAAPFLQTFDSFTRRGRELDSISVLEWFDPAHPLSNPILAGFGPSSRLARLLAENVVSEYGGDAAEQPALSLLYLLAWNGRNALSPLAGTDERLHVRGGNDQLVSRMAAELPAGSIHVARPLVAIRGDAGGPYTCHFATGSPAVADHLVLALPFSLLREVDIDQRIWTSFRPQKRQAISTLPMGTNAKLHLQLSHRTWTKPIHANGRRIQPNGVAYSDPDGFGVAWDGSIPRLGREGVLVDYLGGTPGTQLRGAGPFGPADPADVRAFLAAIEPVFGGTKAAYTGRALQSSWVDDPWHRGAYSHWGIGQYTGFAGAEGLPERRIHFAGEHTSADFQGYIEGAVTSGERAANEVQRGS